MLAYGPGRSGKPDKDFLQKVKVWQWSSLSVHKCSYYYHYYLLLLLLFIILLLDIIIFHYSPAISRLWACVFSGFCLVCTMLFWDFPKAVFFAGKIFFEKKLGRIGLRFWLPYGNGGNGYIFSLCFGWPSSHPPFEISLFANMRSHEAGLQRCWSFLWKVTHICMFPKNNGTPSSSVLIGFSIIFTIHFGSIFPLFRKHPYQASIGLIQTDMACSRPRHPMVLWDYQPQNMEGSPDGDHLQHRQWWWWIP